MNKLTIRRLTHAIYDFLAIKSPYLSMACFDYFKYKGNDALFERKMDPLNQFFNPIIAGFYPDPSFCKKGDTYYLVTSSFSVFPGVPIFTSKDLASWTQIGHVLDRPSQLNLDGLGISHGIYAPAIRFNPYNDTFYMITTSVQGIGNFYVKTSDPSLGWGDPIVLPQVTGFDPSFFFNPDGKTGYIVECASPKGGPNYEGERAIHLHHFDVKNDCIVGDPVEILRSGVRPEEKPIWIEGSHLYNINGFYYLSCAEGGTSLEHSQVILRSKSPLGPYEVYENNPILTQRDLPEERNDKITSTGHADMLQKNDGSWWAVFLGIRPYDYEMSNTGRETFMLPVEWVNGWPIILPQGKQVPIVVDKPGLTPALRPTTGNFESFDTFDSDTLDYSWVMIRTPREEWYSIENGRLILTPRQINTDEINNPSALLRRQQHTSFETETKMEFTPASASDFAGFTLFQNEKFHFVFGKTIIDNQVLLVVNRIEGDTRELLATVAISRRESRKPVYLKIRGDGAYYDFLYSLDGTEWVALIEKADGRNLSTRRAGGFIGTLIGLYTTSSFRL